MNRFIEENDELPSALRDLVSFYRGAEGREKLEEWFRLASGRRSLFFTGVGTSEFTSEAVASRLSYRGRCARSFDAGELYYQEVGRLSRDALFVLTSQSGESVEIRNLASVDWVGGFVAVTNDEESGLAKRAALTLPLRAGREDSITTKTYTNNLALFLLLESRLEGVAAVGGTLDALCEAADALEGLDAPGIEAAVEALFGAGDGLPFLAFAGREEAVVAARQCGLTFMEGLKRPAGAYAGGSFRHGPFESVGPALGLALFRSSPRTASLADGMARDAAGRGSAVVVFDGCAEAREAPGAVIRVPRLAPGLGSALFPILAARSHNALLHALASRLGVETGVFRYGGKITSRE